MDKMLKFDEFEKVYEAKLAIADPIGVAVLGAPAGGKSFVTKKLDAAVDDARVSRAMKSGQVLTVDALRGEFLSKEPYSQMKGFVEAFYVMKQKSKEDPKEYSKWFEDITNLWTGKFKEFLPSLDINVKNNDLYFGDKLAIEPTNMKMLKNAEIDDAISKLDNYQDYKRVVRYFQTIKQEKSIKKSRDVTYDEVGDEPKKMIGNLKTLHKKGYVTDVILIHPDNVATNLIQNFYRVLCGNDGGRDSSAAIMQAYKEIEANKDTYQKNAEVVIKTTSKELDKVSDAIKSANVPDDKSKGDKPIDVLAEIEPMKPAECYKVFSKKLVDEFKIPEELFKSVLRFAAFSVNGIPSDAKSTLIILSKPLNRQEAIKYIRDAANSKKYIYKFGGITSEFANRAEAVLK
jgi:hypothetical protein